VQELRWLAAGRTTVLRDALEDLRRAMGTAGDPADALAAALVHEALLLETAA